MPYSPKKTPLARRRNNSATNPTIEKRAEVVLACVCLRFNVSRDELADTGSRPANLIAARSVAAHCLRQIGCSYGLIGMMMGVDPSSAKKAATRTGIGLRRAHADLVSVASA